MDEINEMQLKIKEFCDERNWEQFHNPKDLAIGISTEANELLDIFRFKSESEIAENFETYRNRVEEELADVFFFVLRFAERNGIDLDAALEKKIKKNAEKYPIDKANGCNKKYTEF